jgi:hypothetical protein
MPKITVHGGPTNAAAGPSITGGEWGDPTDDTPAPVELSPVEDGVVPSTATVTVDGVYAGPGAVETVGDDEASFDYEACTVAQLREFLATRELPTTGLKPELVDRLRADDDTTAEEVSGG